MEKKRIVVGLSGGVDSSMALFFLKEAGWKPVAVTLKLPVWENEKNRLRENICCTEKSIELAKKLCRKLDVPYHLLSAEESFEKEVVKYFLRELKRGRTPNPCLVCNRFHKFPHLLSFARREGIEQVATGHYARKRFKEEKGVYELLRAEDRNKDQTYYLSHLTQEQLARIRFPLGERTKEEVRRKARRKELAPLIRKKESQNFCFVAGRSLNAFLAEKIGERKGPIENQRGETLGQHSGLHYYTLGQRKGLELAGGPYYVKEKKEEGNILVVTKKREDLEKKELRVGQSHWIAGREPDLPFRAGVKIRYRQSMTRGEVSAEGGSLKVVFEEAQFAPTPGQFCVFYRKEVCLGGGVIKRR